MYDRIDWEVSPGELKHTVDKAIELIQHRIRLIFGIASYEIVTFCHPKREFLIGKRLEVEIFSDRSIPLDTVFVLCKSVNGKQIIRPAGLSEWAEYYYRMILYVLGKSDTVPNLVVDMPYLQARIKINFASQESFQGEYKVGI
jgi:hypothetical protein